MILYKEIRDHLPCSITLQKIEKDGREGDFCYVHDSFITSGLLILNMHKNPLGGVQLEDRRVS